MKNTIKYIEQQSNSEKAYSDDKIKNAEVSMAIDISQRSLEIDSMTAALEVASGDKNDFNTIAPDKSIQLIRGGSPYITYQLAQSAQIAEKLWQITSRSKLWKLSQQEHRGGIYTGTPASTIIRSICGEYIDVLYTGNFPQNTLLYGYLPYVSPTGENGAKVGSAKDNLLRVLFAINAFCRIGPNNELLIGNLSDQVSSIVSPDRIYKGSASVQREAPISAVTVLEHQYIAGTEEMMLFSGTTLANQIIVFSEPMHDLAATGFTILESGANYAKVSSGTGTLSGQKYIHTTREITRTLIADAAAQNIARIEDATLVGITNSSDVVARLEDYYAYSTRIAVDAALLYEKPGDVISIYDPYDKTQKTACIESIENIGVSSTLKGRITAIVGYTPWNTIPFEDIHTVLTGHGQWAPSNIPDGTEITVVLIGGGDGGTAGQAGTAAAIPTLSESSGWRSEVSEYHAIGVAYKSARGGTGGNPGVPGNGGKIYRATYIYHTGDTIAYQAGGGGAGETYGLGIGPEAGSPSTFGTMSSNSGSSSADGYMDPVSQIVYAKVGAPGYKGGDGAGASGNNYIDEDEGIFTPDPIVVDGISYTAGARNTNTQYAEYGEYDRYRGYFEATASGGFGGGPAYKANGAPGKIGRVLADGFRARIDAAPGGDGATPRIPSWPNIYGQGGGGGNGGGGGGGFGWPAIAQNVTVHNPSSSQRGQVEAYVNSAEYPVAQGGAGSSGGTGAPGCIHLYYRIPA